MGTEPKTSQRAEDEVSDPTERSRYEYSLFDLCGRIHGAYTGSGDGILDSEQETLYLWLQWRINEGWQPSMGPHGWPYDDAVRALCLRALQELTLCIVGASVAK